jgi:hypothetical protein
MAVPRVEAVTCTGALHRNFTEGALGEKPATWSGGHCEPQLVDEYRRNSDLAPQVARQPGCSSAAIWSKPVVKY